MERKTLTVKEISGYLGVHTDTVYLMVKRRQIPHIRVGNRVLFFPDSIDVWIQEQEALNLHS